MSKRAHDTLSADARSRPARAFAIASALSTLTFAACSSAPPTNTTPTSGTATAPLSLSWDESCTAMSGWSRFRELNCQTCIAGSKLGCQCAKDKPWNGVCQSQADARRAEPDCSDALYLCLDGCGTDCACKSQCLAAHDACHAKDEALESCVDQVCDAYCK